jgi:Skp family chaperone for outer membrane proteins
MRFATLRPSSVWLLMAMSGLAAVFAWEAFCDEPPAAEKTHRIPLAVIDVAKVFKGSRGFAAEMHALKREVELFEAEVRGRQAEIDKIYPSENGSSPPSSADTVKAAELKQKLQQDVTAKRQEFMQAEAKVYANYYERVEKLVAETAKQRDIGTVFRYASDKMDPADRNSVLQSVNRAVIYNDAPDLTDPIIAALNADNP